MRKISLHNCYLVFRLLLFEDRSALCFNEMELNVLIRAEISNLYQ